ncbi:hypothetical protein BDV19DRAFT_7598 [Aspergillus venezuelensis]
MHRFLESTAILTDAAISVFFPEISAEGIYVSNLNSFLWSIPGMLNLASDEFHLAPLSSCYQSIGWGWTHPKVFLDVLSREKITSPAIIRRQLFGRRESSIEQLAENYFYAATRLFGFGNPDATWAPGTGEDWRDLTRWLLRGVDLEELVSSYDPLFTADPLVQSLMYCGFKPPSSTFELRDTRYVLRQSLRCWLENLQSVGVDLRSYGRRQKKMFKADEKRRFTRWRVLALIDVDTRGEPIFISSQVDGYGPILAELKVGPHRSDWELVWDLYGEAYAGEFFEWAEHGRPLMPRSWHEEDIF